MGAGACVVFHYGNFMQNPELGSLFRNSEIFRKTSD
jgi:hypothetical protein